MVNQSLVKIAKRVGVGLLVVLSILIGMGIGSIGKVSPKDVSKIVKQDKAKDKSSEIRLTEKDVKDFLIAYYTKKDLEENRPRYKPFMTDGLYNSETAEEDKPVNQAYKGFIVDQVFESANIYIDSTTDQVLAEVKYSNSVLQEKDSNKNALKNQINTATIRLSYNKVNNKFLVNDIKAIILADADTASYNSEQENSSSSSKSTTESQPSSSSVSQSSTVKN
ncbi:MAG: hypothetical protein L0I49_03065 [Lactococcus raffinolactis]|nr:hypothetical protein [Lactococcus lactis]MDN6092651.1 hypothetical protein [Lactococcus raffinolactis]MDN6197692.1 hypothetical protein [Lactococcus raffinolactis]